MSKKSFIFLRCFRDLCVANVSSRKFHHFNPRGSIIPLENLFICISYCDNFIYTSLLYITVTRYLLCKLAEVISDKTYDVSPLSLLNL